MVKQQYLNLSHLISFLRDYSTILLVYKNYQNFKKLSLFDFWLKLENKGGVEFFEWQEEFHNAGQIFTPVNSVIV